MLQVFSWIFIIFLSNTVLNAQLAIGPRVGINYATVSSDLRNFEPEYNLGVSAGVVLEIGLSDDFAIQPELMFNQRGYRQTLTGEFLGAEATAENELIANYLELGVLAKYTIGNKESVSVFFVAGPSIGFGLNAKAQGEEFGFEFQVVEFEEDINFGDENEDLNPIDVKLSFGGGINIPTSIGQIFVDTRYDLGLANTVGNEDIAEKIETLNRGINVTVGLLVPINNN